MWGVPIGEMLDLERLAERCRELGRWTFFVASAPDNMPGMFLYSLSFLCLGMSAVATVPTDDGV